MMRMKKKFWPLITVLLFYICLTLPALFSTKHFLYNLEPYPDSLFYIVPAWNFVHGNGFQMSHETHTFKVTVPPAYSFWLVPFFAVFRTPIAFYVANLVLGVGALLFLYLAVLNVTRRWWAASISVCVLLLHGFFVWLPVLPMTENVSLFLICVVLWLLSIAKRRPHHAIIAGFVMTALVMTRWALVPVAAVSTGLLAWRWRDRSDRKILLSLGGALAIGFLGFLMYQVLWLHFNPFLILRPQLESKSGQALVAFSVKYMWGNLLTYSVAMLGGTTKFLWQTAPLTSPLVFLSSVFAVFVSFRQRHLRFFVGSIVALLFSQLVLAVPFYVADARYIVLTLPLFSALVGTGFYLLQKMSVMHAHRLIKNVAVLILLFISLVFTQRHLFREVVAANIFHRSQAWQYEAIQNVNTFFAQHPKGYLITVLPPFLTDLYQGEAAYRVMPLSSKQEFMNVSQRTWNDISYNDLLGSYERFVELKYPVYVTNAYLSSQHEFAADFEALQKRFQLTKVAEGCLGTCEIYEVQLPITQIREKKK